MCACLHLFVWKFSTGKLLRGLGYFKSWSSIFCFIFESASCRGLGMFPKSIKRVSLEIAQEEHVSPPEVRMPGTKVVDLCSNLVNSRYHYEAV